MNSYGWWGCPEQLTSLDRLGDEIATARLYTYLYTKGVQMISIVGLMSRQRMQT